MVSIQQILNDVKLATIESQDKLFEIGLKITSVDVSIKTSFKQNAGVGGKLGVGPITIGGKNASSEEKTNSINISFIPTELDVELQGEVSGILVESIIQMASEIQQANNTYPEFRFTSSSIEVHFNLTDSGEIKVIFDYGYNSQYSHLVKITFSESENK